MEVGTMYYTGNGDLGFTTVIGGVSLPKCDPRLETLGALDEVHAHLGLVRALLPCSPFATSILRTQHLLYRMMAEIATVSDSASTASYLTDADVRQLEDELTDWEQQTGGWTQLVTPGDSIAGAHLHIAHTVARRAERHAVALKLSGAALDPLLLMLLNRLSSWLFGCAHWIDTPPACHETAA